jgi:hypothetical protein
MNRRSFFGRIVAAAAAIVIPKPLKITVFKSRALGPSTFLDYGGISRSDIVCHDWMFKQSPLFERILARNGGPMEGGTYLQYPIPYEEKIQTKFDP